MRLSHKTLSDFDAERLVMEMVFDYERSVREARLEKIRGWRKAAALGLAGLAGLSPMKAKAWEPPGQTQTAQASVQDQIKDLQKQIDTKFGKIDGGIKAGEDFQDHMQSFRKQWDENQNPEARLTLLQAMSTFLSDQIPPDDGAGRSPVSMAAEDGKQAGKYYGQQHQADSSLSPNEARKQAESECDPDERRDAYLKDTFIKAWIDGYRETHGSEEEKAEAQAESSAPTDEQATAAINFFQDQDHGPHVNVTYNAKTDSYNWIRPNGQPHSEPTIKFMTRVWIPYLRARPTPAAQPTGEQTPAAQQPSREQTEMDWLNKNGAYIKPLFKFVNSHPKLSDPVWGPGGYVASLEQIIGHQGRGAKASEVEQANAQLDWLNNNKLRIQNLVKFQGD